jgi:hypothetical protein
MSPFAVFDAGELATARDELAMLDRDIDRADREGERVRALGLRRWRFRATLALFGRQELSAAIAFDAALRRVAEELDGEALDRLTAEIGPTAVGKPGGRAT